MTQVRVTHTLDDLVSDLEKITTTAKPEMAKLVRGTAEKGNRIARNFARESAGSHGHLYPRAFKAEAVTPLEWEYGPDADMDQGGMEFEGGSRNQPPHHDMAKSADIVGPLLGSNAGKLLDHLFWPA